MSEASFPTGRVRLTPNHNRWSDCDLFPVWMRIPAVRARSFRTMTSRRDPSTFHCRRCELVSWLKPIDQSPEQRLEVNASTCCITLEHVDDSPPCVPLVRHGHTQEFISIDRKSQRSRWSVGASVSIWPPRLENDRHIRWSHPPGTLGLQGLCGPRHGRLPHRHIAWAATFAGITKGCARQNRRRISHRFHHFETSKLRLEWHSLPR